MQISVNTNIESGLGAGEDFSPQVLQAVFNANTFIAMKTEGQSSFLKPIRSISYTFHGESSRLDMHAMVIVALPAKINQEPPSHRMVEHIERFRLGRACPTGEEIGARILDEVAKVLGVSWSRRTEAYKERMPMDG